MAELTPHHPWSSSPPSTFSSLGATDCVPQQQIPYTGLFPAYHYPTPTDSPLHQQDELPLPPFAPQPASGGAHSGVCPEAQYYGSFTSQPNPSFPETFFKSEPGTQHGHQPLPQFHSHYNNHHQYRQRQRLLPRRTYTPPPNPRSPITARKLLIRVGAIAPSSPKGNSHTIHRSSSISSSSSGGGSGSSNNNGSKRLPSLGPIQQSDELVWRGQMRGFEVLWSCEEGRGPGNGQRRMRGGLERFLAGGEMELGLGLGM
ncbi:uncharacterized protein C8A04DRAFT_27919 [Dichotomopilus funicola]|uniref:Uncharacterized protein n=1 Tax=Dichotomopilus funicola TaxID=1934379 RepID=A0AAN6V477_9PEZI|nr:hypothetical protein C8A04DRAFT_27919 [Dichotomopilus funicola]